ncbi:lactate racemase domain-containing protein [Chloroflexota bacterium]
MAKKVRITYAEKSTEESVPNSATVIQYGTTAFPEIPIHPNPDIAVKEALKNPIGMGEIPELVKRGSKVTIAFDDPIKCPKPSKVLHQLIPPVVAELIEAGVREKDITLLCATGTHCKWKPNELRDLIGSEIYERFRPFEWREGRLTNHDCTQGNVYLGETELGDEVEYDKAIVESDLLIYTGTVYPLVYGGYAGQGISIGLGSTRVINSLHSYNVFRSGTALSGEYEPEKNIYRKHKLAVHEKIENATGKKIFYVDALTGPQQKIIKVFAGHVPELEKIEYTEADKYFKIKVPQFDIVIVGLPYLLGYDTSDNPACACNFAAQSVRMWRNKPVLRENGVIIALAQCSGDISARRPADLEAFKLYKDCFDARELNNYIDLFGNNQEYLYKYHHDYAYHPIHSIYLLQNIDTIQRVAQRTIFAGEVNPSVIRGIGAIPVRSFEEALGQATEIAGKDADILVLPRLYYDPRPIFQVA